MTARREFPKSVRLAAWDRCKGLCEGCGAKLFPSKFAFDHIIADSIGGEPVLSNCQCLCSACHDEKTTKLDTPRAAKTKRQRDGHIGIKASSSRPLPGSKASAWKKKMNGTTERRT